ncbi:hypothetical protein AX14_002935, partial [Amanita brunnescens Koide BX004]
LLAFYSLFVSRDDSGDRDNRTLIEAFESGWWYSSRLSAGGRLPYRRRRSIRQVGTDIRRLPRAPTYSHPSRLQDHSRVRLQISAWGKVSPPYGSWIVKPGPDLR